jgi:uncharacterized repeat protein (TIGR01451 family)
MKLKTLIPAVLAAALFVPAVAVSAAQAASLCVPTPTSVCVAITGNDVTVPAGQAINYTYQFYYNTVGDHYTVQVVSEAAGANGVLTDVGVTPQASNPVSPATTSGSGSFTPTVAGRYRVIVSYFMQGQAAWESNGSTVFTVAAPVVPPPPPVEPPVVVPPPIPQPPVVVPPAVVPVPVTPKVIPKPVQKVVPEKPLKPVGHAKPKPRAKLSLVKTANVAIAPTGSDVKFTIVVGNVSKTTAHKVTVCDAIPANTLYVSASRSVNFHGATACFALGNLNKHAKASIVIVLQVANTATGILVNHASASASNAATVTAKAQVKVPAKPPVFVPAPVTG